MALSDEDVREILRIVDSAGAREISVQTRGFSLHVIRDGGGAAAAAPLPPPAPAAPAAAAAADDLLTIESPMIGTFYRAESPGAAPFIEVGSAVTPETIVCIVEVMKMMNSVPAGVSGTVVEICQENARLVEYGTPLFRVEPA
jgi:acetyl-CoA carboxylase biotin carboxyl carrier protein